MDEGSLSDTQRTMVLPLLQETNIWGKPYITVSAKGIVNGLSRYPNDGADFGPDTTLGATAPGQYGSPYTETVGIQEAINYATINGIELHIKPGHYVIPSTTQYTINTASSPNKAYLLGIPVPSSSTEFYSLKMIGDGSDVENQSQTSSQSGYANNNAVVIDASKTTSAFSTNGLSTANVYILSPTVGNPLGGNYAPLEIYIENINFIAPINSSGLDLEYNTKATAKSVTVTGAGAYPYNGTIGIVMMGGAGYNSNWNDDILIQNFATGMLVFNQWTVIGSIGIISCQDAFVLNNGGSNMLMAWVGWLNIGSCGTVITNRNSSQSVGLYIGAYSNFFTNSSPTVPPIDVDDASSLSIYIGLFNKYNGTTNTYYPFLPASGSGMYTYIARMVGDTNNGFLIPVPTLSVNPPVSDTVYQNTNNFSIRIKIPVTYSPTSTAAATLATGISSTSTVTTSTKVSIPAGVTAGEILTYDMVVPAGWYYELVATNATIGTVEVQAV